MTARTRPIIVTDSVTLLNDRAKERWLSAVLTAAWSPDCSLLQGASVASYSTTPLSGKNKQGSPGCASLSSTGSRPSPLTTVRANRRRRRRRASGVASFVNRWASRPVQIGITAEAAKRMAAWQGPKPTRRRDRSPAEQEPELFQDGCPRVFALDSVSRVNWGMAGSVILGGSHGGIVNGRAIKAPVRAAFFNDAGGGKDDAGISRLPALDVCGIPGATVSAMSARIGDGRDTYESGTISHVNASAAAFGVHPDQSASEAGL